MSQRLLHTPEGVRDVSGSELERKRSLEDTLRKSIKACGYQEVQTPTFEYFDVFSGEIGNTHSSELYKFFDKEGNTLVLRPDFTPSLARYASQRFAGEEKALRLCYQGNTFTNMGSLQGKLKETTQIGAECYGDGSVESEAEMITMLISALKTAGLTDFQISIGHVGYFKGICEKANFNQDTENLIKEAILDKNIFLVENTIDDLQTEEGLSTALKAMTELYGDVSVLEKADSLVTNAVSKNAIAHLQSLYHMLCEKQVENYVSFDLGILSKYNYYTGIVFQAFADGVGDSIAKGGRYDNLLKSFGNPKPAIGFAIMVDDVLTALTNPQTEDKYITFALGKGRLADKTLALLKEIGITCEEMEDKSTRKLIFVNEELKLKFFLAKGPDVPTCVEYGAADIGVVGKDTILEENRNVFEVLDLGFGKCRMCVCGPESARELLNRHERIRVASKYPKIAKEYFFDERHQTVDIIKLNGSVELGPIVELSDVIVDIVETGSTLKENGLVVLEEICPLSARMIVNQVSMRMNYKRITDIIYKLKEKL